MSTYLHHIMATGQRLHFLSAFSCSFRSPQCSWLTGSVICWITWQYVEYDAVYVQYTAVSKINVDCTVHSWRACDWWNGELNCFSGSTPVGTYKLLVEYCKRGQLSFKYVKTFNMDEYVGASYMCFTADNVFLFRIQQSFSDITLMYQQCPKVNRPR